MSTAIVSKPVPSFATAIIDQLGGKRFIMMTGTRNFVYDDQARSLRMNLTPNQSKAKWLKITVNAMDTYDMEFYKAKNDEIVMVKKVEGVYDDMLENIFTDVTGLYTRL